MHHPSNFPRKRKMHPHSVVVVLNELILNIDNIAAIMVAMAAFETLLKREEQRLAILWGVGIVNTILGILSLAATGLLQARYLHAGGGVALGLIALKMLDLLPTWLQKLPGWLARKLVPARLRELLGRLVPAGLSQMGATIEGQHPDLLQAIRRVILVQLAATVDNFTVLVNLAAGNLWLIFVAE